MSRAEGLRDLPAAVVGDETATGVAHGAAFPIKVLTGDPPSGPFRVLDAGGNLLAIYRAVGKQAKPEVVAT